MTSSLRAICRPNLLFCCRAAHARHLSFSAASGPPVLRRSPLLTTPSRAAGYRRTLTRVSNWSSDKSPYDTLELGRDADDDKIKSAYRRLAKFYHPDVYDGRGTLEKGETAEARFIKIQAAYELLIDEEKRGQYDRDHRVNPMKASKAWMEWLVKKRKAFDQRGDVAIVAWAEQQQRELNLRARRLSRSKVKSVLGLLDQLQYCGRKKPDCGLRPQFRILGSIADCGTSISNTAPKHTRTRTCTMTYNSYTEHPHAYVCSHVYYTVLMQLA